MFKHKLLFVKSIIILRLNRRLTKNNFKLLLKRWWWGKAGSPMLPLLLCSLSSLSFPFAFWILSSSASLSGLGDKFEDDVPNRFLFFCKQKRGLKEIEEQKQRRGLFFLLLFLLLSRLHCSAKWTVKNVSTVNRGAASKREEEQK